MQAVTQKRHQQAFTLIELLIVVGILGILAAIIIVAISPNTQLTSAQDAKRRASAREIANALFQYVIENGSLPTGIPTGSSNELPICAEGVTDPGNCVNLDVLVSDNFLVGLPTDPLETDADLIGFSVYQAQGGFITVTPDHLGETAEGGATTGGGSTESTCNDGTDDDSDSDTDCEDSDCAADAACSNCTINGTCEASEVCYNDCPTETDQCSDGVDNDSDGDTDNADNDCVVACTPGGTGTPLDPIVICDCDGLQDIENTISASYLLGQDIDCSGTTGWNGGLGFDPIGVCDGVGTCGGASDYPFIGTLNGAGHSISDLYINRPTSNGVGLFESIGGNATIENVALVNVDITGSYSAGGIAPAVNDNRVPGDVTISKVSVTGTVTGTEYVGGIVGYFDMPLIIDSWADVDVTGTQYVGGLVGLAYFTPAIITNSYAVGSVAGTVSDIGGLVGSSWGTINSSYYDADNLTCTGCDNTIGTQTNANLTSEVFLTAQGWDFVNAWQMNAYPTLQY